jgi:hypothetical protein
LQIKLKVIEWLGFVICIGCLITIGTFRHYDIMDTLWWSILWILMFVGGSITIIAFLIRRFGNKVKSNSL